MTAWHADTQTLTRYATAPTSVDDVTAASIEAHLLHCGQCRDSVAAAADTGLVTATWHAVADRIDRPRRSVAERVLGWLLPNEIARVVAATPALRAAWLLAMTVVVAATVAASRYADSETPFLLLAPLVPLAGIAASFGPAPDPAGDVALATPLHGAGLVLRRALAVLVSSSLVLLAGTAALPDLKWRAAGWVLPALGLTLAALALSTRITAFAATTIAAAAWVAVLQAVVVLEGSARALSSGPVFAAPGQLMFLLLTCAATAAVAARRAHFSILETR